MTVAPPTSSETDKNETPDDATSDGEDTKATEVDHKAEAEKWKAIARKQEGRAKENADAAKKLADLEEQGKTESQRTADALAAAEKRANKAEAENLRMTVALDKAPEGMSLSKVKKLAARLSGETQEDLESDAEELFADFSSTETDVETKDGNEGETRRRPQERLKPGGAPDTEPEETDPTKLAEQVPRMY